MKDDPKAKSRLVAQAHQIFPDRTVVHWLAAIIPPDQKHQDAQPNSILKNLEQCAFLRTWCLEGGKGRAIAISPTIKAS